MSMERWKKPLPTRSALLLAGVAATAAGLLLAAPAHADEDECAEPTRRPVASYPLKEGGTWERGANLRDSEGRLQARQEHAAVNHNGFVYLIGGFVPIQPPPTPTENQPEPFPFVGTGEILAYTPVGHPSPYPPGTWHSLPKSSSFPRASMHHIVAVSHQGKIWALGGHAGPFEPTAGIFVFTQGKDGDKNPNGTWGQVRRSDGQPCGEGDECLTLPEERAAGAAVSVGHRIYLMGGVVDSKHSPDPVNESIQTTASVISLDTTRFPLTWKKVPAMHTRREHFNATVFDGRIFVFQGRSEVSTHLRKVESFDPSNDEDWTDEEETPVGASANILARVGDQVYSFGGEFIASNITATLTASQVFDVPSRSWSRLKTTVMTAPLDAGGADNKHGTYGLTFEENGVTKIMAPGGASTAWFAPMSKVHIFTPPRQ